MRGLPLLNRAAQSKDGPAARRANQLHDRTIRVSNPGAKIMRLTVGQINSTTPRVPARTRGVRDRHERWVGMRTRQRRRVRQLQGGALRRKFVSDHPARSRTTLSDFAKTSGGLASEPGEASRGRRVSRRRSRVILAPDVGSIACEDAFCPAAGRHLDRVQGRWRHEVQAGPGPHLVRRRTQSSNRTTPRRCR
jgi:hypothetical protein